MPFTYIMIFFFFFVKQPVSIPVINNELTAVRAYFLCLNIRPYYNPQQTVKYEISRTSSYTFPLKQYNQKFITVNISMLTDDRIFS